MKELPPKQVKSVEQTSQGTELQLSAKALFEASDRVAPQAMALWEQQVRGMHASKAGKEIDVAARAALMHVADELKQKRQSAAEALQKLAARYPRLALALGLGVALSAHEPIVKDVEPFKSGVETIQKAIKNIADGHPEWMKYDRVFTPQNEESKKTVEQRVQEREKRQDLKGMLAYQQRAEQAIEGGKSPRLKDMVFDLERLAGTPPEKVDQAKQIAEAMIARYAAKAKESGKIDEAFLGEITKEVYGGETAYDWGQASVTEFFLTKKRNCVAVDYAQEMIIEEAIAVLPEQEQKKYAYGSNAVQQHVRTVVTIPIDSISRSFLLDGYVIPISPEKGNAPEKSATIDSQLLKKSLVSTKPIEVNAVTASPGTPKALNTLLDVKTDQPLKRNIVIHGELADSDFVESQLKKENVEPVHLSAEAEERLKNWKDMARAEEIIQIEILEKDTQEKIDKALNDAKEALMVANKGSAFDVWVNMSDVTLKTKEEVQKATEKAVSLGIPMFDVGKTETWSDEAVQELGHQAYLSLELKPNDQGTFDPRLIESWKQASTDPAWEGNQITGNILKLHDAKVETTEKSTVIPFKNGTELLKQIPQHITTIDLRETTAFGTEELAAVARPVELCINYDQYKVLDEAKVAEYVARGGKIVLQLDEYVKLLQSRTQIKDQMGFDIRENDVSDRDISILHNAYLELQSVDSAKHQKIRAIIVTAMEQQFRGWKPSGKDELNLKILENREKYLPLKIRLQKILQQK